jgi:tannase/feruloyl esterase
LRTIHIAYLFAFLTPLLACGATCESLRTLAVPGVRITMAATVPAGDFAPPGGQRGAWSNMGPRYDYLPAFCRVTATIAPENKIEVWMPAAGWNGEFQPIPGGFYGGTINNYPALMAAMASGAATATSNSGIEDAGPAFLLQHPEKLQNMNGAFHAMAVQAKALLTAYYGRAPSFTFMNECGGPTRDALSEVQRFPADLDAVSACGVITQATHHALAHMWVYGATHKDEASYIPNAKFVAIHQAALAACDALDGVKDGVIENPPLCKFDPGVMLCSGPNTATCLTGPQVEAVRKIYTPPLDARTQKYLYAPMVPGGELEWEVMAGANPYPFSNLFFKYAVFKDPAWEYKKRPVNFAGDVDLADAPQNQILNANDPDIAKFIDAGGKLLLMGGWNDYTVAPGNPVDYYEAVLAKVGRAKAANAVRLFMVPDLLHCLGGTNPSTYQFDTVGLLRQWKAAGKAPDQIVLTHFLYGREDRKRLVCAYPRVATYKGSGNTGDPGNYTCKAP